MVRWCYSSSMSSIDITGGRFVPVGLSFTVKAKAASGEISNPPKAQPKSSSSANQAKEPSKVATKSPAVGNHNGLMGKDGARSSMVGNGMASLLSFLLVNFEGGEARGKLHPV